MNWMSALFTFVMFLLGFITYRWQKGEDRKLQVQNEKRESYRNYFATASEFFSHLRNAYYDISEDQDAMKRAEALMSNLYRDQEDIAFFGSKEVLTECKKYTKSLTEYRKEILRYKKNGENDRTGKKMEEVNDYRNKAFALARKEILGGSKEESEQVINELFEQYENKKKNSSKDGVSSNQSGNGKDLAK